MEGYKSYPMAVRKKLLGLVCVVSLCSFVTSCYLPSAVRRSARIARSGWDYAARGPWVVVTGPGGTLVATADLALNAFLPLNYDGYFLVDRRVPRRQWFRMYSGPMLPIDEVAILCNSERATNVRAIREVTEDEPSEARHERWHFPLCLEVLPGVYELEVHYYSRQTVADGSSPSTRQIESTEPSRVEWVAAAGGIYMLKGVLGEASPAPGRAPRSKIPRSRSLGTSRFKLEVSEWNAKIERFASWGDIEEPIRQHRERWRRYERIR
jgi:hypothetical protein